ncbi:LIM and senescent cell antigen-like-containing domain protein 1 [Geodia barretti]|uniref:LIM and senescent cell antigen-like-containing domain protein 1 n=1 Tax=Geodia barretti TaxID=519541 RepID=A0AA35SJE2_GEOBA|nr:LIM and senescent cell antigen-like-containing domain protein 1 [Geodia barretti]
MSCQSSDVSINQDVCILCSRLCTHICDSGVLIYLFLLQLFGEVCFYCNKPCRGEEVTVLNKTWCIDHFRCSACNSLLASPRGGARYADMDERPYCKKCFEKVPVELRRRLKKQSD